MQCTVPVRKLDKATVDSNWSQAQIPARTEVVEALYYELLPDYPEGSCNAGSSVYELVPDKPTVMRAAFIPAIKIDLTKEPNARADGPEHVYHLSAREQVRFSKLAEAAPAKLK